MSQPLPQGSTVLVTGANGFIGSHIIDQILKLGYNVRGTVRDPKKNAWVQEYFDKKHGTGRFSLVQVTDFTKPGCFDEAVKGVDAVAHVASDLNFQTDANAVVTPMVNAVKSLLEAASKEPKVKSVVLTSSSTAATAPKPNVKFSVDKNTWNEEDVKLAWAEKFDDENRRKWAVYGASKTQGEQALWEFVKEKKPHFKANTILPNANYGPILDPANQSASTGGWITAILKGGVEGLAKSIPPQYFVHVQDTARLHAAVVTDLKYDGERLLAFAEPFNWNQLLALAHKYAPKDKVAGITQKIDNDDKDLSTVATADAVRVLKEKYGQDGFLSLDEAMKENIASSLQQV